MDLLDINVIRATVLFDLAGYIGYAFAPTTGIMFLSGMFASLGGIGPPTLQSALTQHIPADKTGQVLGASGLLHALARVVAPTVFNLIYSKTVGIYAGIVFICLASIFVVCFVFSWFLKPGGTLIPPLIANTADIKQYIFLKYQVMTPTRTKPVTMMISLLHFVHVCYWYAIYLYISCLAQLAICMCTAFKKSGIQALLPITDETNLDFVLHLLSAFPSR
jgi:hypothetical protein